METKDWMIPGFPVELRQRVVAAARTRNVTVAQWLTALLTQPGVIDGNDVEAVRALLPGPSQAGPPLAELVSCAVALAGAPGVPQALQRRANRAVRLRYEAINPRIAASKPQIAAETPNLRENNGPTR